MNIVITTLDGRHKGNLLYSHRAELTGYWDQRGQDFVKVREWCWTTLGPSTELDLAHYDPKPWAWNIDVKASTKYYIYLKDEYLTHFTLKWK